MAQYQTALRQTLDTRDQLLSDEAQRRAMIERDGSIIEPVEPTFTDRIRDFVYDAATRLGADKSTAMRRAGMAEDVIGLTPLQGVTDFELARRAYAEGDSDTGDINMLMAASTLLPGNQRNVIGKGVEGAGKGLSKLRDYVTQIGDAPLPGAPQVANIPNMGKYSFGPNPDVESAAQSYADLTGIPYSPVRAYSPLDVGRAERIAREYELMRHDPSNPEVQRAYNALTDELMGQYESARNAGYTFSFDENAYRNSPYESLIDIAQNKHLKVYPTSAGFGSGGAADFDVATNPLLAQSGEYFNGVPATYNDIFRAVHDLYGHAKPGVGFRAAGEENAFLSHAGQLSPLARRALTTETRGQNSFLNYGPQGEMNRTAGIDDTVFADQKTGLLPRWVTEEGRPETLARREDFFKNLSDRGETLEGALADDGSIILTHYTSADLDRVDPAYWGSKGARRTGAEQARSQSPDFIKPSYYGIQGVQNPYRRESVLGGKKYETKIAPELLYDPKANPDKLWVGGSEANVTASERRIADNNYSGYYFDHPQMGKVAVIFDPLDVTRKYMIPIAGVGVTAAAVSEKESPDES